MNINNIQLNVMTLVDNQINLNDSKQPEKEEEFNWKNCWYPIIFVQDFPNNRPYGFTLYDEPFVLFRNKEGKLACLKDICPHRAAKLSAGQITQGKIECLYHGWQFDTEGQCQHIPQLPDEVKIPHNACVKSFTIVEKQGLIWFWRGKKELADENLIPIISNLDRSEFISTDFMIDLPYDQSYLIENAIDPAHVHISHDGSFGNRENAQPLEMEIVESSLSGIRGRYKYTKKEFNNWINLDFLAPNLVTYRYTLPNNIIAGNAVYSLPTAKDCCRLFLRNYSNYFNWKMKFKPLWLSHWQNNRVLEEDLEFIVAEQTVVEQSGKSIKQIILPLKTSDVLVVEYRKWLDKYGKNLPFYQGYTTSKLSQKRAMNNRDKATLDRFKQHTQICSSCSLAYQTTIRLKQIFIGIAIALAAMTILIDNFSIKLTVVLLSLSLVILAVITNKIKTKFEHSYTRY